MKFNLITIFPTIFDSYFKEGMIRKGLEQKYFDIKIHNLRDFSQDKHGKVDDIPYGGGAGMVMTPQPLFDAINTIKKDNSNSKVIYLSPKGKQLTHKLAKQLSNEAGLILVCGRYEGIDQRVIDLCVDEEISIGKYVLTGGELPAMVLIDAVVRFIPEVLGHELSAEEETFSESLKGKKEYPHYTRPPVFHNLMVPEVLQSGHHENIKKWRQKQLK